MNRRYTHARIPKNRNLILTWIRAEQEFHDIDTLEDSLDRMNALLGRRYNRHTVASWRRGRTAPDHAAHEYILLRALPFVLLNAPRGELLNGWPLKKLKESLSLPQRT